MLKCCFRPPARSKAPLVVLTPVWEGLIILGLFEEL